MRTLTIIAAVLLLGTGAARGEDDIRVSARAAPTAVSVGGEVVLTITVEGKFRGAKPELPELPEFAVFESGTSNNFQFINGRMSSSVIYTYVLQPQSAGTFTIDPIRVIVGDREFTAAPVTIQVSGAGRAVPAPGAAPTQGGQTGGAENGSLPGDKQSIFIAAAVDQDTVYVNDQVTWTLGYYTDGRVALLRSPNYTPPTADGFWVEDLPPQNKYYTQLHGRQYLVNEIKRAYFPTAPGTYEIGAARVDVVVDEFVSPRSLLDEFFKRSRGMGKQHTLLTEAKRLVILPLPSRGRPAGFSGVVARELVVSLSSDKQVAQVGEPINVTIVVSGTGNMKTIPQPQVSLEEFKVYESGSSSDTFKRDYVVTGRRKYEYVIVPQVEGRTQIPPVEMSYFDPERGRYDLARSHPVPLDIQPGTNEDGRKVVYAGGGDDIEVINRDIRYIHPAPSSLTLSAPRWPGAAMAAMGMLPLLALAGAIVVERRRRRLEGDVGFARSSRALREALRRLDAAKKVVDRGEVERASSALAEAVSGYFADKMNVARAGLTTEAVTHHLRAGGMSPERVDEAAAVLRACDAMRFAAQGADAGTMAGVIDQARELIGAVEKGYSR